MTKPDEEPAPTWSTIAPVPPRRRIFVLYLGAGLFFLVVVTGMAFAALLVERQAAPSAQGAATASTPTCDVVGINGCTSKYATPYPEATPSSPSAATTGWTPCGLDGSDGLRKCEDVAGNCDLAQYSYLYGDLLDSMIENRWQFDEATLARECPQFLATWHQSLTGFNEGVEVVGQDVQPGTYQTTAHLTGGHVTDCYWERSRNGTIIANNFVSGASKVTVTIQKGDDAFTSRGCGNWVRI